MGNSSHVFNTRKGKATKPTAAMRRGLALRKRLTPHPSQIMVNSNMTPELMFLPTIIVSDVVLSFPAAKPVVNVENDIVSLLSPVNDGRFMSASSDNSSVDTTTEKIQYELQQGKRLVAHVINIDTAISVIAPSKLTQSPSKSKIPIAAKKTKLSSMKATKEKVNSDSKSPSYMRPTGASKSRAFETASIFSSGSRSSSRCFSIVKSPSPSPTDQSVTDTTLNPWPKKTKAIKMSPLNLSYDIETTASSIAALHSTSSNDSTIGDSRPTFTV